MLYNIPYMTKYLLIPIICFALSSCSLFYRVAFAIKNPEFESYSTINKYADKIGLDSSEVAFSCDTTSNLKLINYFGGYQDILIFNREHKFLAYKDDSSSCNASVDTVFKRICGMGNNYIKTKRKIDFNTFIGLLDDHNAAMTDINDTKYDYIIFADFAKFFPKVNKDHLPYWDAAIKSHRDSCIAKIIYVNLDYLNIWNIPKSSLPVFNLSANKK